MGFFRHLAFYAGLAAGVVSVAAGGIVALTYLFTGKVPALEVGGEGTRVKPMTVDEVTALVRGQIEKGRARVQPEEGGESHGGG